MERTRHNIKQTEATIQTMSNEQFHALASVIVSRANLAYKLGQQYGGDRDLYNALGYKTTLTYADFFYQYTRQDIAKAVIDRPVKATWQGQLELIESEDAQKTPFEQAWYDLNKKHKLRSLFSRVDKLTGIGRYGVLFLGLDDVKNREELKNPVTKSKVSLKYIKPFSESTAKISKFVVDPTNERYGLPLIYDIEVSDVASQQSSTIPVHYSRVVHIVQDLMESEVYGTPVLESIFNRLMDIEKLVGGDAEMFWRGARPGFQGLVDKDFQMTQDTKDDLKDQIQEYENNLRRIFVNEGVKLDALAQQIADPKPHFEIQMMCLSAATTIPMRILSGSERGELSSGQDSKEWKTYVQSRREDHAEPNIIRPVTDRLIELGVLPQPSTEDYQIDWLDLFSISEKERVDIGQKRAESIRSYTTNPGAEAVMPPKAFYEFCLGLSQAQIDLIDKIIDEGISEEQKDLFAEVAKIEKDLAGQEPEPKPEPEPDTTTEEE